MNLTDEIYKKYKNIGVFDADIIYIYADLRGFSIFLNQFPNKDKFLESFVKPLLDENLTIIIPTFHTQRVAYLIQNQQQILEH